MILKLLFLGRNHCVTFALDQIISGTEPCEETASSRGCSSVVACVLCIYEVLVKSPASPSAFCGFWFFFYMVLEIDSVIFYPHLQGCVVAWGACVAHVLLKLLQAVKHCLLQQLCRPRCLSDATFAGNRPQLFHAWPQPRQVPTNLL